MLQTYLHLSKKEYIERWREVKDLFPDWDSDAFDEPIRAMIKETLQGVMQAELVGYLRAKPHERTAGRFGYRNGSYCRHLVTRYGLIQFLAVPRPRRGGFQTQVFRRYQRRAGIINRYLRDLFIKGVSTREVGEVVQELLGTKPSATTVSNMSKVLGEEVRRFHCRRIVDEYRYLFLDGVWVKVMGATVVKKVLLIAYGVRRDGRREVVDFRLASSESEHEWEVFLHDLYQRGLTGQHLRLITVDGGKGLHRALEMVYPHVRVQRCWVHKLRNVANYLPRRYQADGLRGARKIYLATSRRDALQKLRAWSKSWQTVAPKAVRCLTADIEELVNFFAEPEALWSKVRTTNAIERCFRELRKRTRPMCLFGNNASCERIAYALFNKYNNQWKDRPLKALKEFTQES